MTTNPGDAVHGDRVAAVSPTYRPSPASETFPGWVRMRPSPILTSLRKREPVPTAYLSFPQNPSAVSLGRRGVSSITRKG